VHKNSKIGSKKDIAKMAAPKAAQFIYNALRVGPRVILRSAFELLRANTITRVLSAAVLLSIDTIALVRGRISRKQYVINVTLALMLLVGGTAGWYLGSGAAAVIAEGVAVGIVAGLVGAGALGAGLGIAAEKLVGTFVKDDTADMLDICNKTFCNLAETYSLTDAEAGQAAETVRIETAAIRDMYASRDKQAYAYEMIEPCVKGITERRG